MVKPTEVAHVKRKYTESDIGDGRQCKNMMLEKAGAIGNTELADAIQEMIKGDEEKLGSWFHATITEICLRLRKKDFDLMELARTEAVDSHNSVLIRQIIADLVDDNERMRRELANTKYHLEIAQKNYGAMKDARDAWEEEARDYKAIVLKNGWGENQPTNEEPKPGHKKHWWSKK